MNYENFQSADSGAGSKSSGLNLCDIVGYGKMLQHDLTTEGPELMKSAMQTKPETAALALGSVALVAVGVAASSEALIGIAAATGICCGLSAAGKVAMDHLPKVTLK